MVGDFVDKARELFDNMIVVKVVFVLVLVGFICYRVIKGVNILLVISLPYKCKSNSGFVSAPSSSYPMHIVIVS